ncbi:MAG TPA: type II secretion system protein N [Burkholderiales bacterium]|nr:type II secretion system protein N [Burkholderiales bacterium]
MQKSEALQRVAVNLAVYAANLAALALLALVLAYWTWQWFAPAAEPATPVVSEAPRIETAAALFGDARPAAAGGSAYTLVGIAAASGGRTGHAVLRIDNARTAVVREGEEIAPGVKVAEVHGDRVVIDEHGARRTLEWPKPGRAAPIAQARNP